MYNLVSMKQVFHLSYSSNLFWILYSILYTLLSCMIILKISSKKWQSVSIFSYHDCNFYCLIITQVSVFRISKLQVKLIVWSFKFDIFSALTSGGVDPAIVVELIKKEKEMVKKLMEKYTRKIKMAKVRCSFIFKIIW